MAGSLYCFSAKLVRSLVQASPWLVFLRAGFKRNSKRQEEKLSVSEGLDWEAGSFSLLSYSVGQMSHTACLDSREKYSSYLE